MTTTGPRLLIIDRSPRFANYMSSVASDLGFEVEITIRVEDFMASVLRAPPDRIVLDILMPEMDGIASIQWLAEQQIKARVIVAAGFNREDATMVRAMGIARGIDSVVVLCRPLRIATLKAALRG